MSRSLQRTLEFMKSHAIIGGMNPRRRVRCALACFATAVIAILIANPAAGKAAGDPRLVPWVDAVSRWGCRTGGEAIFHALAAAAHRLPQGSLKAALTDLRCDGNAPFAAAARDQLLANLEREAGDLTGAKARIESQGYLLHWHLVLPERLAGTELVGDPGGGWVSPADHAHFSGVEPVVLETTINVHRPGQILILTGGNGVAAIRAGEAEVRPPRRDRSLLDQASLCATLPAGPVTLRIELHPDRAARSFAVRLASPDGRAQPTAAPLRSRLGTVGTACVPGPVERWESLLVSNDAALPENAVAGLWLLTRIGAITRPASTLLDRLQPVSWLEMDLLSTVLKGQRHLWEAMCDRFPGCAESWQAEVLQAEMEFSRGQTYRPLLRILRIKDRISEHMEDVEGAGLSARGRLLNVDLNHGLGLICRARGLMGAPAEHWSPDHLDAWVNLAISAGAREEAVMVLLADHRRRPGAREIGSLLGTLLTDAGRLDEAAAIWETMAGLHPADPDMVLEQAQALLRLGRLDAALVLLKALEAWVGKNARVLEQHGRILARAGRAGEAADVWRRALALEPQNPDLQGLLRRLDPVERRWMTTRRSLPWALARTGTKGTAGYAVEGLADIRLVTIHDNGLLSIRRQQILRVAEPGPTASLTLSTVYDPHTEDFSTLAAVVLRSTGEILQALDGDDLSLSQEEFNLHYDLRQRQRDFSRLEAGDVVVWETRLDQFRGARGGVSLVRPLQEAFPKRIVEITLAAPQSLELHAEIRMAGDEHVSAPTQRRDGETALVQWRLEDLPGIHPRPFPPPLAERSAYLMVSTMHGWRHVSEWYNGLLEQQVVETMEMQALVAQQAGAAEGPLAGLARFVADQVRYVGLEFGVNAYVPYPTARVFERRYGDCKDKSLLMVTLLRILGIKAHLALVRTFPYGAIPDPPPSISLFDHAIVRVPSADLWFDPTARYLGTGSLPWQDQGAQVLVLDDTPALEMIPVAQAFENRTDVRLVIQDDDTGGLRISGVVRFSGALARSNYEVVQDPTEWEARVERFLSGLLPGFHLLDAPWETREGAPPLLRVEVDGALELTEKNLVALNGLRFQPRLASLPRRDEDLLLRYPFEEHVVLQLDGENLAFVGPAEADGEGPGCRWSLRTDPRRVEVEVSIHQRRIAASDYSAFRTCLGGLDIALAQVRGQVRPEEVAR